MAFFGIDDNDPEYQDFLTQYRRQTSAPKTGQNSGFVGDTVTGLKRGIQQLPGIATGLADIPAGMVGLNRPFSRGAEWLGEQTGFEPGKWQEQAQQEYSPALQQQRQEIEDTKGFFPTVGAYLARPRAAANLVAEALPGTVAGGFLGRAAMGTVMGAENLLAQRAALAAGGEGANAARLALLRGGATAGGIGEGAVTAGMQMEQTPDSVDPMRAAYTALGAGVGTGLIGRYSGNLATRMGIADPDTMIAAGAMPTARGAGLKGYAKAVGGGMLTEGVLEELPQSMQEQMWQNAATGDPLMRGVPEAGAAGMIAGGLMGAGANVVQRRPPGERPMPENAPTDLLGAPAAGQQLELPFEQPDIEGNDVVTRGMFNPFNRTGTVSDLNEGNPYSLGSAQGDLFEQQGEIEQYNPSEEAARDYASQLQARSLRAAIKAINYRLDGDEENAAYWENESNKLADWSVKAAKDFFKGATAARAVKAKGQKAAPLPTASPAYKPTEVEQAAMDSDIPDAAKVGLFRKDGKMRDHYAKQVMQWNDWADADLLNTHGVMAADFAAKKTIGTMEANRMSILEAVLRNRGVAFTSYAESSAARAAAAPVAGQGAAEAKANAKAPSAVTNIDPATYAAQIGAAPTIRPILPNLGMPTREEIAADMVANPDAYGPSQMTTPRDMLGGNTLPAAVSTPAGPGLAPVPVSTEPTLPAEVKLPKVQQRVFDHVVNAMQNDAIGTVVDAQGVFMIADIGRALNMKPGSVKMALKAIQPHLAKALGAGSVAEVKAQQGTRSVEEADATQLGLAPKEQRTNAIAEEDLFGGGEESAVTQGMGIVSGPGGSQANIFDGDEVKVPEAWLEPTEADKARDAKRAVDARKEADQALVKEARDKVKRAEEAMNTWNEYAESTTPLGTPFHELAERTMALWLLEYDALIEKHGHRSWAQLEPMIAKLYNEYATDTWVNQNEQGKIEATGRVRQPEKLLPAGETGTRSPAAESQAAAPAVEAPAEQVTAEPAPVEVMDDDVADMWNEATAPLGMLSFNQLPDDLRAYLLQQPRTEAALNKRAQEVLDALTAETATMAADLDVAEEAAPAVEAPKAEAVEPAEPVVDKPAPVRKRVTASDKLKEQEAQRKADEATRIANETKRRADRASAEDKAQDQAETLASIVAEVVNGDTTRLEEGRALAGMQPDGSFKSPPNGMLMKTLANVRLMKIVDPKTLTNIPELLALLDTEAVAEKAPTGVKRRVVKKSVGQKEAGTNKDAVTTKLKKLFFNPDNFDKMVTVVQSIEDVPSEYRAGLPATTRGFIAEGKAYLIADNIPAGSELAVMLHELGSHIGMPKLLGAVNYARLVGHIYDWAAKNDNSLESRLAKKALARIRNAEEAANAPMSESDAHDELLAYFIEEAVENGLDPTAIKNGGPLYQWFRTLWAAAKVALRKIGLNRFDDITAQNIVDMAYGAAKLEITGTWHGTAADFRNFNHDYMGSGEGAQAYGWGTYLAQRPGIAKGYWKEDVRRKSRNGAWDAMDAHKGWVFAEDVVDPETQEALISAGAAITVNTAGELSRKLNEQGVDSVVLERNGVRKEVSFRTPEGSLMRADVNVHDDEMLDWDKPLAEQSATVRDIINKHIDPRSLEGKYFAEDVVDFETGDVVFKAGEKITVGSIATLVNDMGHTEIAWADKPGGAAQTFDANMWWTMQHYKAKDNRGGKSVYNGIAFHLFLHSGDKDVYKYTVKDQYGRVNGLTNEGWNKAYKLASEYLDSIGIKGIKFLDAQSRTVGQVAGGVTYKGKTYTHQELKDAHRKAVHENDFDTATTMTVLRNVSRNGLAGAEAAIKADYARNPVFHQPNLDKFNEIKGDIQAAPQQKQTRNLVIFNDKNIHRIYTEVGANPYDIKFSISTGEVDSNDSAYYNKEGFHGTKSLENGGDFTLLRESGYSNTPSTIIGVHLAVDPAVGNNFAKKSAYADELAENGRVLPVRFRSVNPLVIDNSPGGAATQKWRTSSDDHIVAREVASRAMSPRLMLALLREQRIGTHWSEKAAEDLLKDLRAGKTVRIGAYTVSSVDDFVYQFVDRSTFSRDENETRTAWQRAAIDFWKNSGYDSIQYQNTSATETKGAADKTAYIVPPSGIRSRFAQFDKAARGKSGLLFSIGMTNNAAKAGFENQKAGAIAQLKEGANRALHLVAFTRDLVDIAVKEGLTSAANYYKLSNMRDAEQTRIESEVDRILTDAYKLSKGDRAAAQKFIKESTIAQKWGFMPDWKKEATVDPDFKKKFSALSKEAQTTVKNLFRHADTMHKQLQEQINAEIDREYDKRVKAALDAGNDSKAREIERDRKRALSVVGRKLPEMQGPYAPLKRFGNHVFVGKSQRYLDAERDNDKKEIARLIKLREGDYEVTFFDNKYQATVYARENQHRFAPNGTDVFGRQMGYDKFKEVPWGEILKIKTAIEAEPGDLKVKNAMQRLVTDLYISLLSDASARKTEMRREGVEGASDEMFRAFATKGRADAHFFAAMKHNGDIQRSISDMRLQTLGTPGEPPKPDVRARRARVFDEIIKRHDQQLNYTPTPFADKAMRFTSWWMLLTSPGYYIQNALQVGMLTLPVLAGSRMPGSTNPIGAKAAASALTRAYGKGLAKAVLAAGNTLDTEALEKRGMITPAERRMLDTLIMQGKIDITIAQDLGRAAAGEGFMDNMPYVGAGLRAIQNSAQRLEMLNRVVTALAAYRLTGDTEFAGKVIEDSHGNYTMSNAPRWMQGSSAARLLTQFRKFQLIQLSLLGRQVAALMDSKKPEEKAAAWATLRWIATTHGIMAGGLGLPVISQALSLLAPLFGLGGGDDEPEDVEGKLRKAIGNEDASNLLLRGVPAWMGMNMSGKVGMGNTFSVFPFLNTSGQAGYEKALVGMGGAAVATGLNMAKGADLIRDGEYYKGLELMLPKGVRDAMRAGRFANEGITNRRGDVLMTPDELSLFDIGTQGLGLPSTKLQERQRRVGQSIDYDTFYKERTTALRDNYAKAYRAGDQETLNEVRSDWRNMSTAMRANGLKPPPMSSLFKAPMEQRKRERDVVEGVQHTARTKKLVESAAAV